MSLVMRGLATLSLVSALAGVGASTASAAPIGTAPAHTTAAATTPKPAPIKPAPVASDEVVPVKKAKTTVTTAYIGEVRTRKLLYTREFPTGNGSCWKYDVYRVVVYSWGGWLYEYMYEEKSGWYYGPCMVNVVR